MTVIDSTWQPSDAAYRVGADSEKKARRPPTRNLEHVTVTVGHLRRSHGRQRGRNDGSGRVPSQVGLA